MTELYFKYRFLTELAHSPGISQRGLASELGCSLGKANYCLRDLKDAGLIRFANEGNGAARSYVVTRLGHRAINDLATTCLEQKKREYEALLAEVTQMKRQQATQPKRAGRKQRLAAKSREVKR